MAKARKGSDGKDEGERSASTSSAERSAKGAAARAGRRPPPAELLPEPAGSPPRPDEMGEEVVAFITAIEDYKRSRGRPFPNWSEILEIVKSLGYVRTR